MPDDQTLLVAASLGEWTRVLDHINALERTQFPVRSSLRKRLEGEQSELIFWLIDNNEVVVSDPEVVIAEARRICTENQDRLDVLLSMRERE